MGHIISSIKLSTETVRSSCVSSVLCHAVPSVSSFSPMSRTYAAFALSAALRWLLKPFEVYSKVTFACLRSFAVSRVGCVVTHLQTVIKRQRSPSVYV